MTTKRIIAKARHVKPEGGGTGLEVKIAFPVEEPSTAEQLAAEGALDADIEKVGRDWADLERRIKDRKERKP